MLRDETPAHSQITSSAMASAAPESPAIKVLYIIGWGRSGSTILDNLLGELDGFFSVGELHYLWERGLLERRHCGCGRTLWDCEVWSSILSDGLAAPSGDRDRLDDRGGEKDEVQARQILGWQREAVRVRHTWRLLRQPPGGATGDHALDSYTRVSQHLYRAIARVTGARVIIDSSKRPSDAALLRLLAGVVPYYVHLVRDPRAVAYSWKRRKVQLDRGRPGELSRHSTSGSTLSWVGWNLAAEALRKRHPSERSMLVRYEDFVRRPRETLASIASLVEEAPIELPIEGERTARLARNHTVSGNPSRFSTGTVELREDVEWQEGQATADRLLVTSLSLPWLRRYGYPIVSRAHRATP
jgi:Sulfotransferase family